MRSGLQEIIAENRALRARLEAVRERDEADRLANYQARHDLVTGLPNRALLYERLHAAVAEARRGGRKLALMFLDLDGFKGVNDSLGHDPGDRLLKAVAGRMQGCVRHSDTLARYGGDEFALLLPDMRTRQDAATIARKILDRLHEPFAVAGQRLCVGVSIGIALYPEAGNLAPIRHQLPAARAGEICGLGEALMRRADVAMYHVKNNEKNAYRFFSQEMEPAASLHPARDRELHAGPPRGEPLIRYRPRVHLTTGRIVTLEASFRWRRREGGPVEGGEVVAGSTEDLPVPVADLARAANRAPGGCSSTTDLSATAVNLVLRRALRQTSDWRCGSTPELTVAVGLSAAGLARTGSDRLMGNLHSIGLDAGAVTVEVGEAALMESVEAFAPILLDLEDRGVRVVVSEFGAGFSSLRYLERLAIHGLKLAPLLIRDLQPGAASGERTVAAIAAAADQLGLELFAAGVETPEQIARLRSWGFSEAGGPLICDAVPAPEMARLLCEPPFASLVDV